MIRKVWHFYYALVLVIKVECSGIALLTFNRALYKGGFKTMDKVDWHKNHIDDSTIITDSYKTTQNVRRYSNLNLAILLSLIVISN